jgi:hypothetical protein
MSKSYPAAPKIGYGESSKIVHQFYIDIIFAREFYVINYKVVIISHHHKIITQGNNKIWVAIILAYRNPDELLIR